MGLEFNYIKYVDDDNAKHSSPHDPDIAKSSTVDEFKNAGRLIGDREIVIDIDNVAKPVIMEIINEFNIKTETIWTSRGVHFVFNAPKGYRVKSLPSASITPLGINVEYKVKKNNNSSTTIRQNGVTRLVENKGRIEEIPEFLEPLKGGVNLLSLSEGSRNTSMFKHRVAMIKGSVSDDKRILTFINSHVLGEELSQQELNTLLRNDIDVENTESATCYIMASHFIKYYKVSQFLGELYFKHNEQYVSDMNLLKNLIFQHFGELKTHEVDEIIKQMYYRTINISSTDGMVIKFRNGYLKDGQFINIPFTGFTPFAIDLDYLKNAKPNEHVDNYLNHLCGGEKEYIDFVCEVFGHALITDIELKRMLSHFFIFVGDGGNGKGTLLQVIASIFGKPTTSTLSLDQMTDRTYLHDLTGKLINLGDDIENGAINNKQMKILKNISSCDAVMTRGMYQDAKNVTFSNTLVFTSNHILKSFEKGTSYSRRVFWCPMYSKVTKKDPKFITNLTTIEAKTYFIKLIVEGYMRLYSEGKFTTSNAIKTFTGEYHNYNNNAIMYCNEVIKKIDNIIDKKPKELYDEYELYCDEEGDVAVSFKLFKETIEKTFGVEVNVIKRAGKPTRVYRKKGDD